MRQKCRQFGKEGMFFSWRLLKSDAQTLTTIISGILIINYALQSISFGNQFRKTVPGICRFRNFNGRNANDYGNSGQY